MPIEGPKECIMIMGEIATIEQDSIAIAIVIAPSQKEAEYHAVKTLEPYYSGYPQRIGFTLLKSLLFQPVAQTIFLYTVEDGQIQGPVFLGFCKIGCVYYPCCQPSDRGESCWGYDCYKCDKRRCKPNPDGTKDIDNVPCGP